MNFLRWPLASFIASSVLAVAGCAADPQTTQVTDTRTRCNATPSVGTNITRRQDCDAKPREQSREEIESYRPLPTGNAGTPTR